MEKQELTNIMEMDPIKAPCRTCKCTTKHEVLQTHPTSGSDEEHGIDYWTNYQIIKCLGCDTVGYRSASSCSEYYDHETMEPYEEVEIYPDPNAKTPRESVEIDRYLPADTLRIYRETIAAIEADLPLLTAVGLRAIVESVCVDLKTGTKNLKDGIDALAQNGNLSKSQADYLHKHRFMGNEAAHQVRPPNHEQLICALDIAETLLKTIYVLPRLAARIDNS